MILVQLKQFKQANFDVLTDVLVLEKGVRYNLVGENGSGKSTLLKFIFKYYLKNISNKIIFCPDNYIGYQNITIKENEKIYQLASVAWDYQIYDYLYQQLLGLDKKRYIRTLSTGEKTRLLLCLLLAFKPEFIIFDEALSSLDSQAKKLILTYLENYIKTNNVYFIGVSHNEELQAYSDVVLNINEVIKRV